jgi:cation diffusion facilitator family transporter
MRAATPATPPQHGRSRAAAFSIVSNSVLIVLKVLAGVATGSVALLTEAMHSAVDLLASVVAFFSVRKAEEPADESHRYGHGKFENLAAAFEGLLILVGAAVIVFESVRRLVQGAGQIDHLGWGISVIAFSAAVNFGVSGYLHRRATYFESPALAGDAEHLRTDALTSTGVLVGLVLVQVTGAEWIDPVVALMVAGAIVAAGVRLMVRSTNVLVDAALPEDELAAIRRTIRASADEGVVGYHKLRTRQSGPRRHVDLHVQFASGTTLEDAHATAHALQDAIAAVVPNADVLIHLEPEANVQPGTELHTEPVARPRVDAD